MILPIYIALGVKSRQQRRGLNMSCKPPEIQVKSNRKALMIF